MARGLLNVLLGLFLLTGAALASPAELPRPAGWVLDAAGFLTADERRAVEEAIGAHEAATGVEIAVVILPTIGASEPNAYATALGNAWGVGKKGDDTGVVFLIETVGESGRSRAVYIAVGSGLEGALTDLVATEIVNAVVIPRLKAGEHGAAVLAGVQSIIAVTRGESFTDQRMGEGGYTLLSILATILGFIFNWLGAEVLLGLALAILALPFLLLQWLLAILARTRSVWLGAAIGAVGGACYAWTMTPDPILILASGGAAGVVGLLLDALVSWRYHAAVRDGTTPPWWAGGSGGAGRLFAAAYDISRSSGESGGSGGGSSGGGFGGGGFRGGGGSGRW